MGCAVVIGRYIGFILIIGAGLFIAAAEWNSYGLDGMLPSAGDPRAGAIALMRFALYVAIVAGPIVAVMIEGVIRRAGVFVAAFIFGAIVTAPFALARMLA